MLLRKTTQIMLLILLPLILLEGCILNPEKADKQVLKTISAREAYELIEENSDNPDFVIIDVRTESEYDQGYIKDALNIDYYSPDFSQSLDNLDKNNTYLIYCRSGNRSGKALDLMEKLDYKEVYNLDKGIINWIKEGYPLEEECPICSVDN